MNYLFMLNKMKIIRVKREDLRSANLYVCSPFVSEYKLRVFKTNSILAYWFPCTVCYISDIMLIWWCRYEIRLTYTKYKNILWYYGEQILNYLSEWLWFHPSKNSPWRLDTFVK